MNNTLKRIAKAIMFIDEKGKRVLDILVTKPMEKSREDYFQKHEKEMPKMLFEKQRFYLIGAYWIFFLLIICALQFAVRGLFL